MIALRPLASKQNHPPHYSPAFTCCLRAASQSKEMPQKFVFQGNLSRRIGAVAVVASVVLVKEAMFGQDLASGLNFKSAFPDERTVEEAESGVRGYAQSLLELKDLLESESWKAAQKVLRRSSSNLKLDLFTIIQSKPGKERPPLRTLYSNLFNNATKLDYAARDKDASVVWECYKNIVAAYDDILSRL